MTKRDFELIARVIREHAEPGLPVCDIESVATSFADALSASNPRFDRERFLKACGVAS